MALPRPIPTSTTRAALLSEITAVLDPKIALLTSQLATANQTIAVRDATIADRDLTIAGIPAQIASAVAPVQAEVTQLEAEAVIKDQSIEALNDRVELAEAQVVDLAAYDSAFSGLLEVLAGRGLIVALDEEEV